MVEVPGDDLDGQEQDHAQPVEDVVNNGAGEGALKLFSVTDLRGMVIRVIFFTMKKDKYRKIYNNMTTATVTTAASEQQNQ